MEKNVVKIDLERYNELLRAELKLDMVTRVAEADECDYGYRSNTANTIDDILGITREEK